MIIGISGKKQAGKTTTANILHGIVLKKMNNIIDYNINDRGKLTIKTTNSSEKVGWGIFDIERKDQEFVEYAHYNMWPFVKLYNFGDELKTLCINLFGLKYEQCYGTDDQKNSIVPHLLWENMPGILADRTNLNFIEEHLPWLSMKYHNPGPMTAREFMQFMGTEIMRKMYANVWANACINRATAEQSEIAVIADVRFPNEVEAILNAGGKVIRLTRNIHDDQHDSETALDPENFDQSKFWKIISGDISIEKLKFEVERLYGI